MVGERGRKLVLDAQHPTLDLGTIALAARPLAKLKGKPLPEWTVTEARGVDKSVQLADYKGKWVVLDFWGVWCHPCVSGSLPEAIAFQKLHARHADRFAILAFHGRGATTLAEVDGKLPPIRERYWGGQNLPFPILLDGTGQTAERYGVARWPTTLLIDPAGNLVGEATLQDLAAKLPPVTPAESWDAARERTDGQLFENDPLRPLSMRQLAHWIGRATSAPVELDLPAIRGLNLDPDKPLPTVVIGVVESLRSRVELLLEPHGLGITPSADGTKLVITNCSPIGGPPSSTQRVVNGELNAALDRPMLTAKFRGMKPVALDGVSLLDAARRLSREYDLTFAFDPKVDLRAKVTGTVGPGDLRTGLTRLLAPLGLGFEVRSEALVVAPEAK